MSKGLRNMSEAERERAIGRRIAGNTKGLGYLAAVDARAKQAKQAATLRLERGGRVHQFNLTSYSHPISEFELRVSGG